MINVECIDVSCKIDVSKISKLYLSIAEKEGFILGDVSVIIGTDDWLLEYNKFYLDHHYYTDIITFDYVEKNVISGDLLISLDRVAENASDLHVSRETELNRVIIHGFLHLCRYDDKTDDDREIMRKKEDYYLNLL